jgi:predicted RecA/RadA family phage recombinase
MATNRVFGQSVKKTRKVAVTTALTAGSPFVFGKLPGVLLGNADSNDKAVMQLDGVFTLSVKALGASAATTAIAAGDIIYYNAASTPKLNFDTGGVRFGYAMAPVSAATTATIEVQIGY